MKRNTMLLLALSLGLSTQQLHAQIAAKKGVTLDQVVNEVNTLLQKGDDESKELAVKEAVALSKSKKETFVLMSTSLYNYLGEEDKAKEIEKGISKRFPKGIQARKTTFDALMSEENVPSQELEKNYAAWLKKFPKSPFEKMLKEENDKDFGFGIVGYYDYAAEQIVRRLIKNGDYDRIDAYLSTNQKVNKVAIAQDLFEAGQYPKALPIAAAGYEAAKSETEKLDPNSQAYWMANRNYTMAASLYAKLLFETGDNKGASQIAQQLQDTGYALPENTILLSKIYQKEGKDLDAFLVLHRTMVKTGRSSDYAVLYETITPIYAKLNGANASLENYTASLDAEIKKEVESTYRAQMIKKEAPQFSLTDRDGKTVSLADYKGKVVVIDFWATWCGPCKISFPGMQAAVNKYKDDEEVKFLFIDTWQREENYKELVDNFINHNKYTFHVLFDEMKDRTKATTTAFGVEGIPHKVVIDKEGYIRFESSGGSADVEQVVNEMETKIELAKKG